MKKYFNKEELIKLIEELINCQMSEVQQDILLHKIQDGVIDPEISNYIYWSEMSTEEIADKALSYKPIYL